MTFFGEIAIWSFFLIKLLVTESLESLNEVSEGVAGVKNHTKKCCCPYAIFASKMSSLFLFDQMVQKKPRSAYLLRGDDATFEDISGTLFFLWFFYGFKWKFRANLLQGTHRNGVFCSKKPLFDFFKKKSPFQGVTMKNQKMGQNLTFC